MNNIDFDAIKKRTKNLKILFVEDTETVRTSIVEILEHFFDDIMVANDGEDGLNKFILNKEKKFDLILSDINMPKLNGLEMVKKIREIEPYIPVLLLTAFRENDYLIEGIELGVDGYLNKPLNLDKFIFYIKKILHNIDRRDSNNHKSRILMDTISHNIIMTKTDLKGIITYTTDAFCKISKYSRDELLGQSQNIVRHPDMPSEIFMDMWSTIQNTQVWEGEMKNLAKDGTPYWVYTTITPEYDYQGNHIGYISIRRDIALRKEIEILNLSLEMKIEERTAELELEKKNIQEILSHILMPIFITSKAKRTILYANKYACELYEKEQKDIINSEIDKVYTLTNGPSAIIEEITRTGKVLGLEEHITTHTGKEFIGLLSVVPISYNNEDCYIGMTVDITKQKDMENKIRDIHKHTKESIEYAALIQSSLIPDNNTLFRKYFQEYFVIWHPKDTVGGDIYSFDELRHDDECLIMCIDCTGHGVPGAFVTMLVKSVESQLMNIILNEPDMEISTAWIMSFYNKALKKLLNQEDDNGISNVGFDGSVLYYNSKDKVIKFSGAESPFFYRKPDGEIVTVKGTRKSVGYKQCPMDYKYKETIIENVEKGTKVFLTTDGYLDQNGGPKDFPFGKKNFIKIIDDYGEESMADLQEMFMYEMAKWEEQIENNDRNDDITVIGFTI